MTACYREQFMTTAALPSLIIGAVEWVALPDLGIRRLRARVDTGAKTSSLCTSDREIFTRNGEDWVRFTAHAGPSRRIRTFDCEARVIDRREVRSSSGEAEERLVIATTLHLGWEKWMVELTLADRLQMKHRMLLGRRAMLDRVLVNPSHTYLHGQPMSRIGGDDASMTSL